MVASATRALLLGLLAAPLAVWGDVEPRKLSVSEQRALGIENDQGYSWQAHQM